MSDREKILDRIRKLLALAGDGAAGIGEAANAAEIAARLIREHGFDDLDIGAAELDLEAVSLMRTKRQELDNLVNAVAAATGCLPVLRYVRATWRGRRQVQDIEVVYFGASPGPVIATYLHAVCYRAVESAMAAFRRTPEYRRRRNPRTKKAASLAFKKAMIAVLSDKLFGLGWLTSEERARLEDQYQRRSGRELTDLADTKQTKVSKRFNDATALGGMAGLDVDIHRPVSGAAPMRIGHDDGSDAGMR